MIGDLKLGFKLLKYSLQFKMSVIVAAIFMVMGLIFDMMSFSIISPDLSVYYLFGMVFASQMISSLNASQMVQSSPYKKRLQTRIITSVCVFIEFVSITIMLVIKAVQYYHMGHMQEHVIESVLMVSGCILIFNLYMITATKFYWSATGLFIITFVGFFYIIMRRQYSVIFQGVETKNILPQIPFPAAVGICYGAILLGGILMYVISNLLYKREYSKMMFKAALERAK